MLPQFRRHRPILLLGVMALLTTLALAALRTVTPVQAQSDPLVRAISSDLSQVVGQGYEPFQVDVNAGAPGGSLIAIAGTLIGSADGYNQWVFFFLGSTYLGTDTSQPSPQLQLSGNVGPGAIAVQYVAYGPNDPLCCPTLPPVMITYTWNGDALLPNGTPPGH